MTHPTITHTPEADARLEQLTHWLQDANGDRMIRCNLPSNSAAEDYEADLLRNGVAHSCTKCQRLDCGEPRYSCGAYAGRMCSPCWRQSGFKGSTGGRSRARRSWGR